MRSSFERHPQVRRVGVYEEWIVSGVDGHMAVNTTCSTTHPFTVNPSDADGHLTGPDEPVNPADVDDAIRYALSKVGRPS